MLLSLLAFSLCLREEYKPNIAVADIKTYIENGNHVEAAMAVVAVLLSNGDTLSEINSISDAIIHCRGGSGKALPSGPGLVQEMKRDKTYIAYTVGEDSKVAQIIKDELTKRPWGETKGELKLDFPSHAVLSCFTLGHYCPSVSLVAKYEFMELSNNQRACVFNAKVKLYGTDPWDFNDNSCYSKLKNLILERIPNFLVNLRGHMKEFDINYTATEEVLGCFKQNK